MALAAMAPAVTAKIIMLSAVGLLADVPVCCCWHSSRGLVVRMPEATADAVVVVVVVVVVVAVVAAVAMAVVLVQRCPVKQ